MSDDSLRCPPRNGSRGLQYRRFPDKGLYSARYPEYSTDDEPSCPEETQNGEDQHQRGPESALTRIGPEHRPRDENDDSGYQAKQADSLQHAAHEAGDIRRM